MSRPVSILIFPSPLFPAHWSLFIPSIVTEAIGTRIHVHGNARSGFTHEFVRNYDIAPSTQGDKLVPLGWVDGRLLESNDGLGTSESAECNGGLTESRDVDAKNELERIALSVRAPGPSLNTLQKLVCLPCPFSKGQSSLSG